ncbi:aldo-keto reductase AKR2E4-like isoform X4 [Pectinophora gossypiella]|uniref:aldo-keto reductase AKR2E4-like isoform X2 n=1 Tax=Pectinophora gossypiella TaxID=13191 RepID=UPI00214EFE44|nr:aldo-keto reductase AKR2E4-like isoform X2 [Pectinophora gossypiella]XP_049882833.1 aldo-keto reductase AKR2E4-like isoform X4 [Pectinophora gossypiella]
MASSVEVPKLKLNDGREMPAIALGTYLGFDANGVVEPTKDLRDTLSRSIDIGWRHFDTASVYKTEKTIGEAISMKIQDGTVQRSDVFVTTKLWNTHHKREKVMTAIRESLEALGLNYIDLYLMHWPIGLNEDYTHSDVDFMETWRGMEDAQNLGLVKSIGVSNFNKEQLQRIIREGTVKPAALQIEVHPQIIQADLVDFARSEGIVVMGYSPFGSLVMRYGQQFPGPKMDDPDLTKMAQKYGKTTPQIVLRWLVDRNIVPVPKTTKVNRLEENINIFDFKLEKEEIDKINSFDSHTRYTFPSFWQNHPHYPFEQVDNPIADPFKKPVEIL